MPRSAMTKKEMQSVKAPRLVRAARRDRRRARRSRGSRADDRRGGRPRSSPFATRHAHIRAAATTRARARTHAARVCPTAEINRQYAAFLADFRTVEQSYVESINSQSNNTVSVSATLTAPYVVTSTLLQVDNASVFGPDGAFGAPVTALAIVNNVPVATFILTSRSGNT